MEFLLIKDLLLLFILVFIITIFVIGIQEIRLKNEIEDEIESYVKNISRKDISNFELATTIKSLKQWNKIKDKITFDWIKGDNIYKNLSSEEFIYLHKKIGFEKEDKITVKIDFGNFVIKHSETIK